MPNRHTHTLTKGSQTWLFSSEFSHAGCPMVNVLPVDDATRKRVLCLSSRRRMTCQTRNCSDPIYSTLSHSYSVLTLLSFSCHNEYWLLLLWAELSADSEQLRAFRQFCFSSTIGHWPLTLCLAPGTECYDIVQSDASNLLFASFGSEKKSS